MTTRRRALFGFAASIGALGAVGGLATAASAAPAAAHPLPLREALNELRATNEQLRAELEDEKALTAGLERINHHLRLEFDQLQRWSKALPTTRGTRGQYHCSFCGKSQDQVRRLIAGPRAVYICDECVDLCREIINEDYAPLAAAESYQQADRRLMEKISEQQRKIERLQVVQEILIRRVNPPDWPFEGLSPMGA